MGYHTLISVSHDSFGDQDSAWIGALSDYVRNADSRSAKILENVSHGAVKAIATRHSTEVFYVSREVEGFPTQLPYDEQLDEENKAWETASTKARAWLGKTLKLRTMSDLRELVVRLIAKHPVSDAQILAADGAFFARRKLENTSWQPTRADYEALKNRLAKIEEVLGEPA
jgi:hypothetical protein